MTEDIIIPEGFKFCECSLTCVELIQIKPYWDSKKQQWIQRRFKNGHQCRGENNPMHGISRKGEEAPRWNGGISWRNGYKLIYNPDHPNAINKKYVREHRLIIEQKEGRYLTKKEVVHHVIPVKKGGTNDTKNLILFSNNGEHLKHEITKDLSNRFCLLCKSKETLIIKKNGRPNWLKYEDGHICNKCYMEIYNKRKK